MFSIELAYCFLYQRIQPGKSRITVWCIRENGFLGSVRGLVDVRRAEQRGMAGDAMHFAYCRLYIVPREHFPGAADNSGRIVDKSAERTQILGLAARHNQSARHVESCRGNGRKRVA